MNKNDFYNGTLKARFIPKDEFIANRDIDTWKNIVWILPVSN
jgi:hypothetical protein